MSVTLKAGRYQEPDAPTAAETILGPLAGREGYVFGFWQVRPLPRDGSEALTLLIEEHLALLANDVTPGAHVQHKFERFLRGLNEALAAKVREGGLPVPVGHVHAIVGVVCEDALFFSGMGDLSALFLHRRADGQYQVYNLFRSIQTEQTLPSWEKPFAVVLDGDVHPGDALCVSNHDLPRAIQPDELNRYLSSLPPVSAMEKIRQHFPARTDLSLLILQAVETGIHAMNRATPRGEAAVEQMVETEAETDRLLADQGPSLIGAIRTRVSRWQEARVNGVRRPGFVRVVGVFKTVLRVLISLFLWMRKLGGALAKVRSRTEFINTFKSQSHGFVETIRNRVRRVPPSSRYLLAAAAMLGLALVIGINVLSASQARLKADETYRVQVISAEEKRDQAAAALIYREDDRARALYKEVQAIAAALPTDTPERKAVVDRLLADVISGFDQIRHVVNIPNPPVAADLAALGGDLRGGTALATFGKDLYAFGSDKKAYRYDAPTKSFLRVDATVGEVGTAVATVETAKDILYLDSRPGISRFDPANKQLQVTDLKPGSVTWADLVEYSNRLYVLSPSLGQVVRYAINDRGFDGGSNWIKAKSSDLSTAVSLAIDGTVYVLRPDGTAVRFATGNEVGWALQPADPPVTGATDIWTNVDSTFVYVLDPAGKRLLVYAKESGAFTSQYYSDAFTDLKDFHVDEAARTMYLLSGSKLFAIAATHLK